MIRRETCYFDKVGTENTPACQELLEKAVAEGWRHAVVASTTGVSGAEAARRLAGKGANLVVVGHSVGFKGPNLDEFLPEHYQEITRLGGKILKATILTHSLEASLADMFKGSGPAVLIASSLRRLGQGLKVCCEIVMEAVDAGLIPEGEEVVAIGGTARGWDTVAIVRSAGLQTLPAALRPGNLGQAPGVKVTGPFSQTLERMEIQRLTKTDHQITNQISPVETGERSRAGKRSASRL